MARSDSGTAPVTLALWPVTTLEVAQHDLSQQ
jgi:hypothetical protein